MKQQCSELFDLIAQLGFAVGATPLNKHDGCWEYRLDDWIIAVNGHGDKRRCSFGAEVPPYHAWVDRDGFPVGLVSPSGGLMARGGEDELIAALNVELRRIGAKEPA